MKSATASVILISLALTACAVDSTKPVIPERGVTPGYECDSEHLQDLIGKVADADLGDAALKRSGARSLRWIPPNSAVTMDFRQDRLNIEYDEKMRVARIKCG